MSRQGGTVLFERETGLSRLRLDEPDKVVLSNKKATDVAYFIFYSFLLQASLSSEFVKNKMSRQGGTILFERETGLEPATLSLGS
jgi:hypothetical protein